MDRRFFAVILVILAILGGVFWFSKPKHSAPGQTNGVAQVSNHTDGAGKKGVTLLQYGDLQCPVCGTYYPILKQVRQKYGDDITFQYRNFPLTQIHPKAFAAHRAAEAAGLQGKFFEMHDLLYERQKTWTVTDNTAIFEQYAKELGLNVETFRKDFASELVNDTINADLKAGQALGVNGTPTFFINGQKIVLLFSLK